MLLLILLAVPLGPVGETEAASNYKYVIKKEVCDLYIDEDGGTNIVYQFTIENKGDTLDRLDIRMPNRRYELNSVEATLMGNYISSSDITRSDRYDNGVHIKFSNPIPPSGIQTLTVTAYDPIMAFEDDLYDNFAKVEVAHYSYGKDEQRKYSGWNGSLKVNGKYAWKFVRFDSKLGGIVHDYVRGEDVRETTGRGAYLDITSMVTPGENTITYYHFTEGPGIGVKVRIHGR